MKLLMRLFVSSTPLPGPESLTYQELGPVYPTVCAIAGVIERELPSWQPVIRKRRVFLDKDMDSFSSAVFFVT
jgi:hypothetical protein